MIRRRPKAGVMANDIITELNDEQAHGLTLKQAAEKMRGPVNTKIKLTITRKGRDKPIVVTMVRDVIRVKSVRWHTEGDAAGGYIRIHRIQRANHRRSEEGDRRFEQSTTPGPTRSKASSSICVTTPGVWSIRRSRYPNAFLDKGEIVSHARPAMPSDTERFNARPGDLTKGKLAHSADQWCARSRPRKSSLARCRTTSGRRSLAHALFGKGSVQSHHPTPGPGNGAHAVDHGAVLPTPSGRSIQAKGIEPDT